MPIPPKTVSNPADTGTADIVGGVDWDDLGTHLANMNKEPYTWYIYKDGSTYKAKNGSTGVITYSNTDFKTVFQAIVDTIPVRDATVFTKIKMGTGIFDTNTTITILDKYNVSIQGSGIGITRIQAGPSLSTTSPIFDTMGSVSGTARNLTANTTERGTTCTMSSGDASTFTANDYVLIRSNVAFASGGSASGNQGEIKQIASIASGVITFREALHDVYLTASTANVIKLNMSRNIEFADFTVGKNASYTAHADNVWWRMFLVDRLHIKACEIVDFTGTNSGGCQMISCINARVSDCHAQTDIAYNTQYIFSFNSACENCTITNCTAWGNHRHPFELAGGLTGTNQQGAARNITCTNCTAVGGGGEPFHCHPEGDGISVVNCNVLGKNDDGGIRMRARRSLVMGCTILDAGPTGGAIVLSDNAFESRIIGCTIKNSREAGIRINDALVDCMISNCYINNSVLSGIDLSSGCDGTVISDNIIINNDADGIDVNNCDNMMISNNIIKLNGGFGIDFTAAGTCTNNIIMGNRFSSNTSGQVDAGGQTGNVETGNYGYP